ncbi:MAG: response regulator transcription factor [Bacteroidota bacterium]
MKSIKILLADDHLVVRNGIKLMLSQQKSFNAIIEEAEDGDEVIKLAGRTKYDVILLDINLPKIDGIAVSTILLKKDKTIKILALTMHNEEYMIKQMISAGALGYLLKNIGLDELTKAIITVNAGNKYYCNEAAQILININNSGNSKELNLSEKTKSQKTREIALSSREKEVIMYIAKEFNSAEIAEELYISKRTVEGHRKNIIAKLNLKNSAGIVKYAIQNGLVSS